MKEPQIIWNGMWMRFLRGEINPDRKETSVRIARTVVDRERMGISKKEVGKKEKAGNRLETD